MFKDDLLKNFQKNDLTIHTFVVEPLSHAATTLFRYDIKGIYRKRSDEQFISVFYVYPDHLEISKEGGIYLHPSYDNPINNHERFEKLTLITARIENAILESYDGKIVKIIREKKQ